MVIDISIAIEIIYNGVPKITCQHLPIIGFILPEPFCKIIQDFILKFKNSDFDKDRGDLLLARIYIISFVKLSKCSQI